MAISPPLLLSRLVSGLMTSWRRPQLCWMRLDVVVMQRRIRLDVPSRSVVRSTTPSEAERRVAMLLPLLLRCLASYLMVSWEVVERCWRRLDVELMKRRLRLDALPVVRSTTPSETERRVAISPPLLLRRLASCLMTSSVMAELHRV